MTTQTTTAPPSAPGRVLPLPDTDAESARFTFGLLHDVAKVLEAHGYPALTGLDVVQLGQALFGLLYAPGQAIAPRESA